VREAADHWPGRLLAIARLCRSPGPDLDNGPGGLDGSWRSVPRLTGPRRCSTRLLAPPRRARTVLDDQRLRRHLPHPGPATWPGPGSKPPGRACSKRRLPAIFEGLFYLLWGLEWHKRGQCDRARAIYDRLLADGRTPVHLQAWSRFKLGELLLDDGREEDARQALALALALKPDLAKARLLLVPAGETLRVRLGDAADDAAISVPMAPLDAGLWAYYFTRRRPDQISLELPAGAGLLEWTRLGRLLADYLAPGGQARLRGAADEAIPATLGRFGLTSIRSDDGVLLLRAPDPVASRF